MIILVADDMLFNRMFLMNFIQSMGHTCILVSSGREAIDYLTQNNVDAIILDIEMPDMNGMETATYIKQDLNLKTPIASITSHNAEEYEERLKKAGFDYFIEKPVSAENLFRFFNEIKVD